MRLKVNYNALKNRLASAFGHECIIGMSVKENKDFDETYCCGVCDECKSAIKKECDMFFDFVDSLSDSDETAAESAGDVAVKKKIMSVIDAIEDYLCAVEGCKRKTEKCG